MWTLHRELESDSVLYDRYHGPEGDAVVYGRQKARELVIFWPWGTVTASWPDTAEQYGGDSGQVLAVRIRPDNAGGWWVYVYVYSGDSHPRSEWKVRLP